MNNRHLIINLLSCSMCCTCMLITYGRAGYNVFHHFILFCYIILFLFIFWVLITRMSYVISNQVQHVGLHSRSMTWCLLLILLGFCIWWYHRSYIALFNFVLIYIPFIYNHVCKPLVLLLLLNLLIMGANTCWGHTKRSWVVPNLCT
jgi:hypothetical protein